MLEKEIAAIPGHGISQIRDAAVQKELLSFPSERWCFYTEAQSPLSVGRDGATPTDWQILPTGSERCACKGQNRRQAGPVNCTPCPCRMKRWG